MKTIFVFSGVNLNFFLLKLEAKLVTPIYLSTRALTSLIIQYFYMCWENLFYYILHSKLYLKNESEASSILLQGH